MKNSLFSIYHVLDNMPYIMKNEIIIIRDLCDNEKIIIRNNHYVVPVGS